MPLLKRIRILVYPNITFQKDLEKDSFVQVIKKQISLLNEIRDDLWFYLILPKRVESLAFPNVSQYLYPLPTYPPTMRAHFDVTRFKKLVSHDLDFDLVFCHLPEQAHALKTTIFNLTHHTPKFFGYCHWFDLNEVVTWHTPSFLQNMAGLLELSKCYLNTEYQKKLVLKQAAQHFNRTTISKLDEILEVQHPRVDSDDVVKRINSQPDKIIVFNHRPDTYKNYGSFLKICDELWTQRQDFEVWVPLLGGKLNRPYLNNEKGDKDFYYDKLSRCCVGFSPQQKYGGWSVATTDGMMKGVPFVMYDAPYYQELNPTADFFKSDEQSLVLLNKYLDNRSYRNRKARESLNFTKRNLIYDVNQMSKFIDELVLSLPSIIGSHINEDLGQLKDLFRLILNAGRRKNPVGVTKKELFKSRNWGRGIKWTPYRQRLLSHGSIYDIGDETPEYFFRPDQSTKYKESSEYNVWLELLKRQEPRDKKIMSKLMKRRISER